MGEVLGHMLTWTTYGTWLQGDGRGWVKGGTVYTQNHSLFEANRLQMKEGARRLGSKEKEAVRAALIDKATKIGQEMLAIAVYSNHVHLVLKFIDRPIPYVAQMYKRSGTTALRKLGVEGKVWTKRYHNTPCYDIRAIENMIDYVNGH